MQDQSSKSEETMAQNPYDMTGKFISSITITRPAPDTMQLVAQDASGEQICALMVAVIKSEDVAQARLLHHLWQLFSGELEDDYASEMAVANDTIPNK